MITTQVRAMATPLAPVCLLAILLAAFPPASQGSALSTPVDLSHYYDLHTISWPGGTPFHFTKVTGSEGTNGWYAVNDFETAEHAGTHLDAPYHFNRGGWHVGDIPLHRLVGKAVYLDLRDKAESNPDYQVSREDFTKWEESHGPLEAGVTVILDFGWSSKYDDPAKYFGTNNVKDTSSFHFPGLSEEGATWLAQTGRVFGVGTDTASIDYGQTKTFGAHKILAQNKIYNLEHLNLPLEKLPENNYRILALPMKIRNGTGAPCRVLALP